MSYTKCPNCPEMPLGHGPGGCPKRSLSGSASTASRYGDDVTSGWAASFADPVDPPPDYGMIGSSMTGAMLIEDGYLSPDAYDRESYDGGEGRVEPFSGAKDDLAYLHSRAHTLSKMEEVDRGTGDVQIGGPVFHNRTHRHAVESHEQGQQAAKAEHRFRKASDVASAIATEPGEEFPPANDIMNVTVDDGGGDIVTVREVGFAGVDENGEQMYEGMTSGGRRHRFSPTEIQGSA